MRTTALRQTRTEERVGQRSKPTPAPPLDQRVDDMARNTDWLSVLPARADSVAWRVQLRVKRAIDVCLAVVGLVVLSPVLLAIALLVALDSPGAVLYPWVVVGYRGRRFTGYKFRTMVPNADALKSKLSHLNQMSGPVFKIKDDPRVTRIGRFLRKFSLDELPQLWSVLVGDMTMVGPRPLSPSEFVHCRPDQRTKLAVQPGITCLWQVSGRSSITDFEEWVRLDHEYIASWTLLQDLKILLRTIPVVLVGRDAY